jgi:hypothetical protein
VSAASVLAVPSGVAAVLAELRACGAGRPDRSVPWYEYWRVRCRLEAALEVQAERCGMVTLRVVRSRRCRARIVGLGLWLDLCGTPWTYAWVPFAWRRAVADRRRGVRLDRWMRAVAADPALQRAAVSVEAGSLAEAVLRAEVAARESAAGVSSG